MKFQEMSKLHYDKRSDGALRYTDADLFYDKYVNKITFHMKHIIMCTCPHLNAYLIEM